MLQTCYDVAIMHSEVCRLNSWQRICACLVFGVLIVNIVVVQELETGVINYLAWFLLFTFFTDVNNRINVYFELTPFKEGSLRRFQKVFIQKYVYTFVCLRKVIN